MDTSTVFEENQKEPTRSDIHLHHYPLASKGHHKNVVWGEYDQHRYLKLYFLSRIPNLALSGADIDVNVIWTEDNHKQPYDARVEAQWSGFSWISLDQKSAPFAGKVEIRDKQVILFELNYILRVPIPPINPVMLVVKPELRFPCVITGWLDTKTDHFRAQLSWR